MTGSSTPRVEQIELRGSPARGRLRYLVDRLVRHLQHKRFDMGVRGLRGLPPIRLADSGPIVLSMVCQRDLLQYIAALYSLRLHLQVARVVAIDDGSLRGPGRRLLSRLCPGIELRGAAEFSTPGLPGYSSWRRLEAVAQYAQEGYVVQMDSDTLARGSLDEVAECVRNRRAFILPTRSGTQLVDAPTAQAFGEESYRQGHRHVQCLCERALTAFPEYRGMRYVRGCAGFAGYPEGSLDVARLQRVSRTFEEVLGDAWPVWGSEQVTNNVLVANQEGARVLPISLYDSVDRYHEGLKFVHFIGYFRFVDDIYRRLVQQLIADARSVDAGAPETAP